MVVLKMISVLESNYIDTLPLVLSSDEDANAFAKVLSEQIFKIINLTTEILIYTNIDKLEDNLLDILAVDFKCDWYDTSADIDTKRDVIKNCLKVHKYKGTKWAVETAINSLCKAEVKEWTDYNGKPYMFDVNIISEDKNITEDLLNKLLNQIDYYKNARSHLETINTIINKISLANAAALLQVMPHITVAPKEG